MLATTGDEVDEADGSVSVTVAAGDGYTVGDPASGTVAMRDDDAPLPAMTVSAGDAVMGAKTRSTRWSRRAAHCTIGCAGAGAPGRGQLSYWGVSPYETPGAQCTEPFRDISL